MPPNLQKVYIPALHVSKGGQKGRMSKECLLSSGWRAGQLQGSMVWDTCISNNWFDCTGANGPASVL